MIQYTCNAVYYIPTTETVLESCAFLVFVISYRLPRVSDFVGLSEREGIDEGVREAVRLIEDCEIDLA